MKIRVALALALVPLSSVAWAGEEPVYAPAPDWVTPAPPLDPAKLPADAPALLIFDSQHMLKEGEIWEYADVAARVASAESLAKMGTMTLSWHPAKGDLIVHRAEILRGDERINLLGGDKRFTVLRREQQLERQWINGVLSATMQAEGLRVGDILRFSFSVVRQDPALGGNAEAVTTLISEPVPVHFARARLLWPETSKVQWRGHGEGINAKPQRRDGYWDTTIALPLVKQIEMPKDAPPRYQRPPLLEASSFARWADVSKATAPLYHTQGLIAPGSALAEETAKIAAATTDQHQRAAMALRLVQDQVRYLFNGMGDGNYVPQTPAQTWELRYGDCKAKTLLLLALLQELGIEAEPVLANINLGDMIPERLPSFGAFNHVLVRAVIGGQALWLDGTASGTRLADLTDVPPFRNVLPVRAEGAELAALPARPSARPDILAEIEYDQSAGISFPPRYKLALTVRSGLAAQVRQAQAQADKSRIKEMVQRMAGAYVSDPTVLDHRVSFDDDTGTARIEASGLANLQWNKEDERFELGLDRIVDEIDFEADRARPVWKDIPVAKKEMSNTAVRVTLRLPEEPGFALDGDTALSETIAGVDLARTSRLEGSLLTYEDRAATRDAEISTDRIAATRERLALAKTRLFSIRAPADYPAYWQEVTKAKAERRVEPILAAYSRDIESNPDEARAYLNRARFLDDIYEPKRAITDLDQAIRLDPSADNLLWRARLFTTLGEPKKALGDIEAARAIDPGSEGVLSQLAQHYSDQGETAKAIELVDARIASGGEGKEGWLAFKADLLANGGKVEDALKVIDAAIATNPGDPELLNSRCWLKGTRNVALDTALKDCTKAIELAERPASIFDSRAMVYFRMGRLEDALADLEAAYALNPSIPAVMYMRGVIRHRRGDVVGAKADIGVARMMYPRIDWYYGRFGVKPEGLQ